MAEGGNSGFRRFGLSHTWCEIYFVDDGKISLVTADKQLKNRSIWHWFGIYL